MNRACQLFYKYIERLTFRLFHKQLFCKNVYELKFEQLFKRIIKINQLILIDNYDLYVNNII